MKIILINQWTWSLTVFLTIYGLTWMVFSYIYWLVAHFRGDLDFYEAVQQIRNETQVIFSMNCRKKIKYGIIKFKKKSKRTSKLFFFLVCLKPSMLKIWYAIFKLSVIQLGLFNISHQNINYNKIYILYCLLTYS